MHHDITTLLEQLRAANGTAGPRPLGRCYRDDGQCGGRIWRREQQHDAWRLLRDRCVRRPVTIHDGPAYCDRCGTTWDGAEIHRLHLILEQQAREAARPRTDDGRPMLTATEIVDAGLAASISSVRVIAHRRGVRAVSGHYDPAWFDRANIA